MESGQDTNLSETQTSKLVEAGALRPWTTGDLPPAPEGGFAYLKKAVGPGLACWRALRLAVESGCSDRRSRLNMAPSSSGWPPSASLLSCSSTSK